MAVQPHLYQLFHPRPSGAQTSRDALVLAFWRRLFPGKYFGPNHRLDRIFVEMSHFPDVATRPLGYYYFDQVTCKLPTRDQVKHRESCNLQLHCFDSWADLKRERQRATERHGRLCLSTNRDARPSTGIRLTGLGQMQNPNTGRSISTKEYIYMMYGHCQRPDAFVPLP